MLDPCSVLVVTDLQALCKSAIRKTCGKMYDIVFPCTDDGASGQTTPDCRSSQRQGDMGKGAQDG